MNRAYKIHIDGDRLKGDDWAGTRGVRSGLRVSLLSLLGCFLFGAGGCAVNTAACLRRLGRPAKVLGKVADDLFGNLVIEDLKRLGIDASNVSRSRTHPTSATARREGKGQFGMALR